MMTEKFLTLADKLDADAAGIRRRVASASTKTMHPMRSEAAALERAARMIRAQVSAALAEGEDAAA